MKRWVRPGMVAQGELYPRRLQGSYKWRSRFLRLNFRRFLSYYGMIIPRFGGVATPVFARKHSTI